MFDDDGHLVSPRDPKHFEPCWCRSGKKFKICHRHREQEAPLSTAERLTYWRSHPRPRLCLAGGAPAGCSAQIANAHFVQRRGGGLSAIARDGKVYGFKLHPMFFLKQRGHHAPELIGIGSDVTLPMFCSKHDNELFKECETKTFLPTDRQLLELNYRTVAARLYVDRAVIPQLGLLYLTDRGLDRDAQRRHFVAAESIRRRSNECLRSSTLLKSQYDAWYARPPADVNALVLRFEGRPEFTCAAVSDATRDFQGQNIPGVEGLTHVCFYTLATAHGMTAVFSWIGRHPGAERLCSSLLKIPKSRWAAAVLQYAIETTDTVYFQPDWWENAPALAREYIIRRLTTHADPFSDDEFKPPSSDDLMVSTLDAFETQVVGKWQPLVA